MPEAFDESEWENMLEQHRTEQNNAGIEHICATLGMLRDELRKKEFTDHQAFVLVREYFCILIDRFYQPDLGEEDTP